MITKTDVRIEQLDNNEIGLIDLYTKEHFADSYISTRPSQFETGKKYNPDYLGIIGEWAFLKYMNPQEADLPTYLKSRPLFRADRGDFQFGEINIDVKNQICNVNPLYLLNTNNFMANIETKHIKKDFLTHFVMCLYNPEFQRVYIMGYISKDLLIKFGSKVRKGDQNGKFTYKQDAIVLEYKYLDPIVELAYGQ